MRKLNLIFIFLILVITAGFWLTTIHTPYWWDSAGYIIKSAKEYADINFSSLILPSETTMLSMARFPFFPLLLALVWKVFGESLLVSHLFYLTFVLLSVIFTYLLGKRIARTMKITPPEVVGFCPALLLLFTPVFLAQVGIIYTEIPITAFALMAVYFFLSRKILGYLLSASTMLLLKEVSAVIILAILITILIWFFVGFLRKQTRTFKKLIKDLFIHGSPILLLIAWFLWRKFATGWLLISPTFLSRYREEIFSFGKTFFLKLDAVFDFFFLDQGRFLIAFAILICLFFLLFRKKIRGILVSQDTILLFLIVFFVPLFFAKIEFLHRYIVFGLPFLYILFCSLVGFVFRKNIACALGLALLVLLPVFYSNWDEHRKINSWHFPPLEENLEYLDIIKIGKLTSKFLEEYYKDAVIYTEFPTNYMLSQPFQHYVQEPLNVKNCKDYKKGDKTDIVVFHYFTPNQGYCLKIIEETGLYKLVTFSENGKSMTIYKK
ncbi:MAG: hypothetical protein COT36_04840 [Parcubacteria group bacterium CG08_land_8_20_14_0_20_38_56]|nr:MAG: hypothetical protein COT36_04840 [Parcubacteria group bacterium CG08_land_8_20_14_0_20_38_56]